MKLIKLHSESIFNLILIVLSLTIIILSIQLGFGTLRQPGSGLFPLLAGVLILCSGLLSLFSQGCSEKMEKLFANWNEVKRFFGMIVTFILWILLLPFLGYVTVTFFATFAFSKVMKLEGWGKPLLLSTGTSLLSYLLFDVLLYLDLPRGILG